MKLSKLQELFFKTITRKQDQNSAESMITTSKELTPADRLFIYQNAYRLRLEDALRDDYEVCIELIGEKTFEALFQTFCDTHYSDFKTLNGFTQTWLKFINNTEVDLQIKDLAFFEWKMIESFYSHISEDNKYPDFLLSENPRAAIRLDNSVRLMESDWPIHKTFETKKLQNENKTYLVFWTDKNPMYYSTLTAHEYLLIQFMKTEKTMDDIFLKLGTLSLPEEELASLLQTSIANFMKYGFLLKT